MDSIKDIFSHTNHTGINYIEYSIFFPPKSSKEATIETLHNSKRQIESLIEPIINGHLWQTDNFKLRIVHNDRKDPSFPFLFGFSRFGDCINDEWFIVYILYQVSKLLKDAIIAVADNDGEFLLIEAASALPEWLDPSNSDNRVYIYQDKLHIIPLPKSPAGIFNFMSSNGTTASKNALSRQESINIIWQQQQISGTSTVASDDIQRLIDDRTQKYCQQQQDQHELHHARTVLFNPKAAYVLLSAPQLLPLAVEAFYFRDPISLKACANMRHFPPSPSIDANIDTVLPWTRTTFAQALHQQFYAPKAFHLPAKHHDTYQAAELGMKLMCGLEMIYSREYHRNNNGVNDTDDINASDLMEMAPTSLGGVTPREKMDELLVHYSPSALKQLLETNATEKSPDNTDWMDIYPDELESLLAQKTHTNGTSNGTTDNVPVNLEEIMAKFEDFLEHSSSNVDGVNMDSEDKSDEGSDSEDDRVDEQAEHDDADEDMLKQVSFDFTSFMDILKQGNDKPSPNLPSDDHNDIKDLKDLMYEMDKEITGHEKIGGSFVKSKLPAKVDGNEERLQDDNEKEDAPVDIQLNLIQNILESFKGQQGLPGPTGNLLRQFKIALPVDSNDSDDGDDDSDDNGTDTITDTITNKHNKRKDFFFNKSL
ncbi:SGT1 protein-domain-containing protein [Chlamydoabsidia padenii]|nr:SGT1 protein-domain-containing protein [Chlamydoabsidia padenii]